ncbi:MAG: winged helix-turn-helix transcriptional regulator [Flaviramulus sp.]|nr:winged helix-turn-helix domain-containing protein [Flaviramulus sp.]NNC50492.1 winged helix-turn-helix transcriptional regulator [Flaviramulus sp.]
MKNNSKYLIRSFGFIVLFISILSCNTQSNDNFSDMVKVSLRDVGHKLLLTNQDSTSLVKPVLVLGDNKYQIEFENTVAIHPDSLSNIIKRSFEKADLPRNYLTEVSQCKDQEVAYSYSMHENVEKGIIPCRGRELKKECYVITVHFTDLIEENKNYTKLLYVFFLAALLLIVLFAYNRKAKRIREKNALNYTILGRYKFYPEQNKLIKEAIEISLSKKECELLALFVEKPDQIIKREELTKKVWEDKGVIVGRSLDTYISKLRNKLKDDNTINIINVHGVGYKLEMNQNS